MGKVPKVTPEFARRAKKAGYEQPRHGKCLVCSKSWMDCPHTRTQIDIMMQAVRVAESMGMV